MSFDRYLAKQPLRQLAEITPELLDAFLASRQNRRPRSYNHLLGVLRRLFDWMVAQELIASSPLRARPRRETAKRNFYMFDLASAQRLIELAESLPDNNRARLRGPSYATCFALLYGLGLRVGEVTRLKRSDVDLNRNVLIVRETKFAKTRLVPFGPRLAARLETFLTLREAHGRKLGAGDFIFSFTPRGSVHPGTISQTFHLLVPRLNLDLPAGVDAPRLHDLRRSFAVATLTRWYISGIDPGARLNHLATFLGHADPSSTAVYLSITDAILGAAAERFSRFANPFAATNAS